MKYKSILLKFSLVIAGIITALLFTVTADRIVGFYLNKSGYFKAMQPEVTEIYDTSEFNITSKISSQGLRNGEVKIPKPKGTIRILAVGDSYTYGWGVNLEDSWPKLLEKKLKEAGYNIEIINAGVPGASPTEYRRICKAYINQFQADAVIIGIFGRDDLYQAASKEASTTKIRQLYERTWPTFTRINRKIIVSTWYENTKKGATYVSSKYWSQEAQAAISQAPSILKQIDPEIVNNYLGGKINPSLISNAYTEPDYLIKMLDQDNFKFALDAIAERLKRIKDECTKGKPAITVTFPGSSATSKEYFKYRIGEGYLMDERLLTLDLDTPFSQIAKNIGLKYVALTNKFRNGECKDCYYKWDFHFNQNGNKKVAEEIYPQLVSIVANLKK